jgi:hypothetical protein
MNGVPNAFTIPAWPVVSSPGATCPPFLGIVDSRCAACNAGVSEMNGIFVPFYEYLARCGEDVRSTTLKERMEFEC